MAPPYRHILVEREDDVYCIRLKQRKMQEADILAFADEVLGLMNDKACLKVCLALGQEAVDCLYSVFLAKLVTIHRRLHERGGRFILCDLHPAVSGVFKACHLDDFFEFAEDRAAAVALLKGTA